MPKKISDETVFRATLRVLTERGYAGATTRLIAAEAGVNEATLYRKYGSKPELVTAAVRHSAFATIDGSIVYTGDIAEDLLRAAEAYSLAFSRDGHLFVMIMSEMARHPELRQTANGPKSIMRELAALMARYMKEGVLVTTEDPPQAVASFVGPLIVISMLQHARRARAPAMLKLESHVHRFLHGRC